MATRIIVRFSLNADTHSTVRNHVRDTFLSPAGIQNTGTGTWELTGNPVPAAAVQAAAQAVGFLANPAAAPGANATVATDHLWLYID